MRVSEVSLAPRGSRTAAALLVLLLAGCEGDTAELIRDIEAARAGCTQEKLQAGAEECVEMMERYAEMGTEAIQTYIGAVKSMDQALQRMPAPSFDTTGLGHAFSHPPEAYSAGEMYSAGETSPLSAQRAYAPGYDYAPAERWPSAQPAPEGWNEPAYRRDPGGYAPSYDRPPYGYDGGAYYGERRYQAPYPSGEYGGRYPGDEYGAPYAEQSRWRNARERVPYPDRPETREEWRQRRALDRPTLPPERGQLLPPEERLRRPWLYEQERRDPRYRPRYAPEEDPRYAPERER